MNKKKFKIIETPDYMLAVSDEEIKKDEYYVSLETNFATEPKERYVIYVKSTGLNGLNPKKIIAHLPLNNASLLEGVMLLPDLPKKLSEKELLERGKEIWCDMDILKKRASGRITSEAIKFLINKVIDNTWSQAKNFFTNNIVEDDIEKLAEQLLTSHPDFKAEGMSEYQNGRFNGIIEGLNYKSATKAYSEDDMRKAFKAGISFERSDNKNSYNDYEYNKDILFNEVIQSLKQTKPK